jgi:hypothetical protein
MSEHVKLEAGDGHELDAYVAHPEGGPIAGLVVVQEIFGVNRHIRSVADGYAEDGFLAVAPALFDRYERGVELGYEGEDMQRAVSLISRLNLDQALKDTAAALEYARRQTRKKRSGGLLRRTDREVCRRASEGSNDAAFWKTGSTYSEGEHRSGAGGKSRGAGLLVRRGPRLQLQRSSKLQRRSSEAGEATLAGVSKEASGVDFAYDLNG